MKLFSSPTSRYALVLFLLCAALTTTVFMRHDVALVFADSVQPLSMADNIHDYGSVGTSVLRYPEHFEFGTVPAPQTVWPPGMGMAIAMLIYTGMSSVDALTLITFFAAFAIPPLVFFAVVRCGRPPVVALIASLFVLTLPWYWTYTLRLMTEMTFLLCTLAAFIALLGAVRRDFDLRFIALGALFSALAFLMRYAGLFFMFAAGLVLLALVLRTRTARAWRAMFVYGAIAGAFVGWLMLRNMGLTQKMSGGQFEPTTPLGYIDAVVHLYWSIKNMLLAWFRGALPEVGALLVATALVLAFVWVMYRAVRSFLAAPRPSVGAVATLLAGSYAITTAAVHTLSAALTAGWFLDEPRYFFVVLPLISVAVALYAPELLPEHNERREHIVRGVALAVFAALSLHAGFALRATQLQGYRERYDETALAIQSRLRLESNATIGEFLKQKSHPNRAVLTTHPESLYVELAVPSVGLTESRFTNVQWDVGRTQALLCALPIDYMLVIGHQVKNLDKNAEIVTLIFDGKEPEFLRRIGGNLDATLLSVERGSLGQDCVS